MFFKDFMSSSIVWKSRTFGFLKVASTIAENTPTDTIGNNVASGANTRDVTTVRG